MIYSFLQMCKELTHHSTPQSDLTPSISPDFFGGGGVEGFYKEREQIVPPKEVKP